MIKQAQEYKKQCELLTKQETEMKSQVTNTKREVPTGYIAFVIYFQEHYKLTIWGGGGTQDFYHLFLVTHQNPLDRDLHWLWVF